MNSKNFPENHDEHTPALIPVEDIAFDIDGVVADTFRSFVALAGKDFGISIQYDEITEYEFWKILAIDEETTHAIIRKLLENPVEAGIRPVHGAPHVIRRLLAAGPVRFVTARPDPDSILVWMTEVLGIPNPAGIILEATGDHEKKASFLIREDVKYFVEDRLETCYLLHDAAIVPIVFDQPWNRKPSVFRRVRDWGEIEAMIAWPDG